MRRKTWVLAGSLAAAVLVGAGVAVAAAGGRSAALAAPVSPVKTATVVRGKLTAEVSVTGTLTYRAGPDGSPYSVVDHAGGIYTELPQLGQVISQGQVLYRVDDTPVVLLYGPVPAYRSMSVGATGVDVAELNADLVALGYATTAQVDPASDSFGAATATALAKLQAAVGADPTGMLTLGQAAFEPAALRVTDVAVEPGGTAQDGTTVLEGTSTARQVQLQLDPSQQTDVAAGDRVDITLPDNRVTPGVVASVGTVATCPPSSPPGSAPGPAQTATDSCGSGAGANSAPTVAVAITPTDPAATGSWDQAPVQVGITTAAVDDVLAVPVTALLARPGGGYGVEVVGAGGADRLLAVSLGLFDDASGLVQVSGPGLAAGQTVVVAGT